jgi:hypothetical protein
MLAHPKRDQGRQLALRLAADEAPLLALQAAKNLDLPALLDPLDRPR